MQMQENDAQLTATLYSVGLASFLDASLSMHAGRTIVETIRWRLIWLNSSKPYANLGLADNPLPLHSPIIKWKKSNTSRWKNPTPASTAAPACVCLSVFQLAEPPSCSSLPRQSLASLPSARPHFQSHRFHYSIPLFLLLALIERSCIAAKIDSWM